MPDINTHTVRFYDGGSITINDGTSDLVVKQVERGTVQTTAPHRPVVDRPEGADFDTPVEGPRTKGILRFDARASRMTGNELIALAARDGVAGVKALFTVTVRLPDFRGATTGDQIVMSNAYFAVMPQRRAGAELDTISPIDLQCSGKDWAVSRYS
jgi:hypothetical protein